MSDKIKSVQYRSLSEFGTSEERNSLIQTNDFTWGDCNMSLVSAKRIIEAAQDLDCSKLVDDLSFLSPDTLIHLD